MQQEVQSPFNVEMAMCACEEKEGGDEVMGVVCVAVVIVMYCIQHADRVLVPSWNICSARPPEAALARFPLRIYIIKRAGLAHG